MVLHEFCLHLLLLVVAKLCLPVLDRLVEEHDCVFFQYLPIRCINLIARTISRGVCIGTIKHLVVVALAIVGVVCCQLRHVHRHLRVVCHSLEVYRLRLLVQHTVAHLLKLRQQHLLNVYLRIDEQCTVLLRESQAVSLHKQILVAFRGNTAIEFVSGRIGEIHITCSNADVLSLAHTYISREAHIEVAIGSHILRVATCLDACGSSHRLGVGVGTTDCLSVRKTD